MYHSCLHPALCRWKSSLYTTRAPLYLLKWLSVDPQMSNSLANVSSSRPPRLSGACRAGATLPECGGGTPREVATSGVGAGAHVAAGLLWKLFGGLCIAAAMLML